MQCVEKGENTGEPLEVKASLLGMVGNLAKAVVKEAGSVVRNDAPITEEAIEARLAICVTCDRYLAQAKRCKECGCFMKFKSRLRNEHCPLGKW